jgi:hypothetical protein
MRTITVPLPVAGFAIATRAMLGAGLGLLVSERLSSQQRRAIGSLLVALGALATIPAVRWMSRGIRRSKPNSGVLSDPRLIGATRYARKGDDY